MSFYTERLESILNDVALKMGIRNYQIKFRNVNEKIENYFGVLIPATLIGEICGEKIHRDLIIKVPPNKQELRDAGVLEYLYDVEIYFYTTIIPRYKSLSKTDLGQLFAECYYSDTSQYQEVIVLKDMVEEGFQPFHGDRFLDYDHVIVSLRSLAHLHALSMLLQNEAGNIEKSVLNPYTSDHPHELMVALKGSLNNHLDKFKGAKHEAVLKTIVANFDDVVNDCVYKTKHLVYGHGDFWKENILYKYKDNRPVKACILDFQTVRLLCPAQDVLGFLFTSTEAKVRRKYQNVFLETYYDHFRQILVEHGLDPDNLYSRSDFNSDLQTVAPYCFVTTNMSFSLWLGLEKDALVKSKHLCTEENSYGLFLHEKTMLEIVEDFVNFGNIKT